MIRITICFNSKHFHARVMENENRSGYNHRQQCKKRAEKRQAELKNINKTEIARVHHQICYKPSEIELYLFAMLQRKHCSCSIA